jgi:hypothetical protein
MITKNSKAATMQVAKSSKQDQGQMTLVNPELQ